MNLSIKTTLRHLWRYRMFTSLNILGLAISLSACWIIYRIVNHEFSYNRSLPNSGRMARVISGFVHDGKESRIGGISAPIYEGIRQEVAGLEHVVPVYGQWISTVEVGRGNARPYTVDDQKGIVATDSSYFAMLDYRWLAGSPATALSSPENVVLTESRAQSYFPGAKPADMINQTITYYTWNDTLLKKVSGVVAEPQQASEFTAQEFTVLPERVYQLGEWTNTNGTDRVYLQFREGADQSLALAQINKLVSEKEKEFRQSNPNAFSSGKYKRWFELLPLHESHYSTAIDDSEMRKVSKTVLYGLVGVAIFLVILACINYINMSVAQIPQRTREIGVRKTLGSSRGQLIGQFLTETFLTALFALLLAGFFSWLGYGLLNDLIPDEISLFGNPFRVIAFAILLALGVTLLAGIYPAWLITRIKTAQVFNNAFAGNKRGQVFSLQKALIVFQFVIALVFITGSLIGGRQLHYSLKSDMGFNKDAVVTATIPWKYLNRPGYAGKPFTLLDEIRKQPGVQAAAMGGQPMSDGFSASYYEYRPQGKEPVQRVMQHKWIDSTYISLYDMQLLAGRNLRQADTANELVINEAAVKAFGLGTPQEAVKRFLRYDDKDIPVVGVVKDFHTTNFYSQIEPLTLKSEKGNLSTYNIKLNGRNPEQWQAVLKAIEKKWYEFYPAESFSYKFYDETIDQMYQQERNLATLVNLSTVITTLISCLGLFGLVTLTAYQRTKEIGIRKVLGATTAGIVQLLSKEYLLLIVIAFAFATPIAWWAMNAWLGKFAYRIEIRWWMFALAGAAALIIALATVSFQAVRAAIAKPVKSLRTE